MLKRKMMVKKEYKYLEATEILGFLFSQFRRESSEAIYFSQMDVLY